MASDFPGGRFLSLWKRDDDLKVGLVVVGAQTHFPWGVHLMYVCENEQLQEKDRV